MKSYKYTKFGILVLALAFFTNCYSQPQKGQGKQQQQGERPSIDEIFTQMDSDNDGQLSKSEVKGPLENDFSTIDVDGDGYITKEELTNAPKPEGNKSGDRPPQGNQSGDRPPQDNQ